LYYRNSVAESGAMAMMIPVSRDKPLLLLKSIIKNRNSCMQSAIIIVGNNIIIVKIHSRILNQTEGIWTPLCRLRI
jgi:hypothetical protein